MHRRALLACSSGALLGTLTGCLEDTSSEDACSVPTDDPTDIPPESVDSFEREKIDERDIGNLPIYDGLERDVSATYSDNQSELVVTVLRFDSGDNAQQSLREIQTAETVPPTPAEGRLRIENWLILVSAPQKKFVQLTYEHAAIDDGCLENVSIDDATPAPAPGVTFDMDYIDTPKGTDDFGISYQRTSASSGDVHYKGVRISHAGGASIDASSLTIAGSTALSEQNIEGDFTNAGFSETEMISAGDSITVAVEAGDTIQVVWTSDTGEIPNVITEYTVPEES